MFKKLKKWFNNSFRAEGNFTTTSSLITETEIIFKRNMKAIEELCSKLNVFKYRTLSRSLSKITLWKQDSGNVIKLSPREAQQLLIYLQFSNSEVPRYTLSKTKNSKLELIRKMAEKYGYKEIAFQTTPPLISFKKNEDRINVYHTTMAVGTCIIHPKKGKTQLFRKKVSLTELNNLFKNPRQHTGKGYYSN